MRKNLMSTEGDSECAESNGGDSACQEVAPENNGDDGIAGDTRFRTASSELLKAMYYWVLSRT
jgi:hypothetical protein